MYQRFLNGVSRLQPIQDKGSVWYCKSWGVIWSFMFTIQHTSAQLWAQKKKCDQQKAVLEMHELPSRGPNWMVLCNTLYTLSEYVTLSELSYYYS